MSLPYRFTYLSTEALWPYQEQVHSLAAVASVPYFQLIVLDHCVRNLRLFRDCDAPYIRDVRVPETHQHQSDFLCRDREQLIQDIASALLAYESHMVRQQEDRQESLEKDIAVIKDIRSRNAAVQQWFRSPKGRWSPSISRKERVNERKVAEGLTETIKLLRVWYGRVLFSPLFMKLAHEDLVGRLYEALAVYGPSLERVRPVYSGRALHAAIFSVLEDFGIEKPGDQINGSRRVAVAIGKFRSRNPPSVR